MRLLRCRNGQGLKVFPVNQQQKLKSAMYMAVVPEVARNGMQRSGFTIG